MTKTNVNFLALIASILIMSIVYSNVENYLIKNYVSVEDIEKNSNLKISLDSGKIVMFGSSELTRTHHKYIPINFFQKELKLPFLSVGRAGHKEMCILTELMALESKKSLVNARVIVVMSAGWFFGSKDGTETYNFLKYVGSGLLKRLYFSSTADKYYKNIVSKYVKGHLSEIESPSFIYRYAAGEKVNNSSFFKRYIYKRAIDIIDTTDTKLVNYNFPDINYSEMKEKAKEALEPYDNNPYGFTNKNFIKLKIAEKIKKMKFPYSIKHNPIDPHKNEEFQDFINLVHYLKKYKHKPLFIFINSNPLAYANHRESMYPVLDEIEKILEHEKYGYLNLWTYKKEDFEIGSMVDQSHVGELDWIKMDKKIIEYFSQKEAQ